MSELGDAFRAIAKEKRNEGKAMRTKFPNALALLDECSRALREWQSVKYQSGVLCDRYRKLERMVRSLIFKNGDKPIISGMTIFHMSHEDPTIISIEDALTPDMLELPDDMKE